MTILPQPEAPGPRVGEPGHFDHHDWLTEAVHALDREIPGYALPVGAIIAYAGTVAPAGWLLCDGRGFSSVTFGALFDLLGAATTPDLRGAFVRGGTPTPGAPRAGADAVALTAAQMPSHAHATTGGGGVDHLHGNSINPVGGHSHGATFLANGSAAGGNSFVRTHGSSGSVGGTAGAPAGDHNHSINNAAADRSLDHNHGITAAGGGEAFSTVPVHVLMAYIIRARA